MTGRSVYIVLPGDEVGGAQKRMTEVWSRLVDRGHERIRLVLSMRLRDRMAEIPALRERLQGGHNVHTTEASGGGRLAVEIARIAAAAGRGAVFHYPLDAVPLLHTILRQRLIKSYTHHNYEDLRHATPRRRALFFAAALSAWKLDVLNPGPYEAFASQRLLGRKARLTAGSFVDTTRYTIADKRNRVVFAGRFAQGDPKNALWLARELGRIHEDLVRRGVDVERFLFLGAGPLEPEIRRLAQEHAPDVPVTIGFEPDLASVLSGAKVFLSIQNSSNYPSQSLLEAMASGVLPIITDVGESRLMADEAFATFVSSPPSRRQVTDGIAEILRMDDEEYVRRARLARRFVEEKFSVERHIDYYERLYGLTEVAPPGVSQR